MENLELNKALKDYVELSQAKKDIEAKLKSLKSTILESLGDEDSYNNGYYKAEVQHKQGFKYLDEQAIANFLKLNGYTNLVHETVDTELNKLLKENLDTFKPIKAYYEPTTTDALTVKAI